MVNNNLNNTDTQVKQIIIQIKHLMMKSNIFNKLGFCKKKIYIYCKNYVSLKKKEKRKTIRQLKGTNIKASLYFIPACIFLKTLHICIYLIFFFNLSSQSILSLTNPKSNHEKAYEILLDVNLYIVDMNTQVKCQISVKLLMNTNTLSQSLGLQKAKNFNLGFF